VNAPRKLWIWLGVWLFSRALCVVEVGFWASGGPHLQDVGYYESRSHFLLSHGEFPGGGAWQYPPGAGLLMLAPRLVPAGYGAVFVGLMLAFDLAGLLLLARLAAQTGKDGGVWVWLVGIPLLGTFSVLRFDLVPTVIAIAALLVVHRRPGWFGALAGLGAAVKLWPALVLLAEWDRRRARRAGLAALATIVAVVALCGFFFADADGFLSASGDRGLQEEAAAAMPWQAAQIVSGDPYPREVRHGAWEIVGPGADGAAIVLRALSVSILLAAGLWWRRRERLIRAGRVDLEGAGLGRDFVFTIIAAVVVTSPVLSPQYMVWLLGLAAIVLSGGSGHLRRPAWVIVGAASLSTLLVGSPELILIRDLAISAATLDAAITMARLLKEPRAQAEEIAVVDSTWKTGGGARAE
jgi:hypothetical protein